MRIIVYYIYMNKDGEQIESIKVFTDKLYALRFMKKVDGKKFTGYVTGWKCDDAYDNEWLNQRHSLHHPLIGG